MMKIGIFWFHHHQILGKTYTFSLDEQDSLGLIDSPFTHIEVWQEIQATNPPLIDMEYEKLPRGRLIFNTHKQKVQIYLDQKLCTKQKVQQIYQFFELQPENCLIYKDPHYRTTK